MSDSPAAYFIGMQSRVEAVLRTMQRNIAEAYGVLWHGHTPHGIVGVAGLWTRATKAAVAAHLFYGQLYLALWEGAE